MNFAPTHFLAGIRFFQKELIYATSLVIVSISLSSHLPMKEAIYGLHRPHFISSPPIIEATGLDSSNFGYLTSNLIN